MEDKFFLDKIESKYILKVITSYIKDENFVLKLISNSKHFQKLFDIELTDYQEKYFEKRIYYESYLYSFTPLKDINLLRKQLKEFSLEFPINESIIKKLAVRYFKKYLDKNKDFNFYEKSKMISFYSPFFNDLSKEENFGKIFSIDFPIGTMNELNLRNDYLSFFETLNNSNSNYSSIEFNINNVNNIDDIKDCKIKFDQIKKMVITLSNKDKGINYDSFFGDFFSSFLTNIQNNLVYFSLQSNRIKIDPNLLENINNLKSLKYLELISFGFNAPFAIKLNDLKSLKLFYCDNIRFQIENNTFLYLELLDLTNCSFINSNFPIKCPILETCCLKSLNYSKIIKYNLIFDFKSFNNLKNFSGDSSYLFLLESKILENVNLNELEVNKPNIEKQIIEKLISMKTLKNINFTINRISFQEIEKINGENESVTNMKVYCRNGNGFLCDLEKKFPQLVSIIANVSSRNSQGNYKLEIEENPDCKINNLTIRVNSEYIKLFCQSYEKLESINFNFIGKIESKDIFPILNDKCQILFKSLKSFILTHYKDIDSQIIYNIYNNIDNMPNLENFSLYIYKENIDREFFKRFLKKVLSLESIRNLYIDIKSKDKYENYSREELKELFPDINIYKLYRINIPKL